MIPVLNNNAALWMLSNQGLLWGAVILLIVTNLTILCIPQVAREFPTNYLLLLCFTLAESYIVAYTSAQYESHSVLLAAFLAGSVVLSLTIYALTTTNDLTLYGGSLYIFSTALFICSLVLLFLPNSRFMSVFYSALSVILFGFYLIYDV